MKDINRGGARIGQGRIDRLARGADRAAASAGPGYG
jgi:hypothetical protein